MLVEFWVLFLNPPGKAPLFGPFPLLRGIDEENDFGVVKAKDFTVLGGLYISSKGYIVMLWNFLYVPALLAISDYLFTAPEHLVGQKAVSVWVWERDVYSGAAQAWSRKKENQKTGCFLGEQAGSRAGQGKEWAGATLGPELEAFLKGEREPGHRGAAKLSLKQ